MKARDRKKSRETSTFATHSNVLSREREKRDELPKNKNIILGILKVQLSEK